MRSFVASTYLTVLSELADRSYQFCGKIVSGNPAQGDRIGSSYVPAILAEENGSNIVRMPYQARYALAASRSCCTRIPESDYPFGRSCSYQRTCIVCWIKKSTPCISLDTPKSPRIMFAERPYSLDVNA